ncbi:hypothetical protein MMC30_007142 [Trapelia coarctata]|nr:hypothetical protein [Trapelia coarctata]
MAVPRLPFLYPQLYKPLRTPDLQISFRPLSIPPTVKRNRQFHHGRRQRQESFAQRYGPAAEPAIPPQLPPKSRDSQSTPLSTSETSPAIPKKDEVKAISAPPKGVISPPQPAKEPVSATPPPEKDKARTVGSEKRDADESHPRELMPGARVDTSKPLETVLHLEVPTSKKAEEHHLPHLHAPPYVHHFDTYSLVKDLEKGNFTEDQSITLMKAVRGLLAVNLDVAKEGLVSKSDVENETYLFRAACSELRTEIQNARKSSSEKMRTERAHLQHEMDILSQKLTQDSLTLKDDLKGMFNDRKMAVRMEQRAMESAIQELNYKITVALNSDSRGYVEGLRWTLTRRAAMAIAAMAILILGSLRYSSYMIHLQQEERKKMGANAPVSSNSGAGNYTTPSRSASTQTEETGAMIANMDSGSNPSFVSLG